MAAAWRPPHRVPRARGSTRRSRGRDIAAAHARSDRPTASRVALPHAAPPPAGRRSDPCRRSGRRRRAAAPGCGSGGRAAACTLGPNRPAGRDPSAGGMRRSRRRPRRRSTDRARCRRGIRHRRATGASRPWRAPRVRRSRRHSAATRSVDLVAGHERHRDHRPSYGYPGQVGQEVRASRAGTRPTGRASRRRASSVGRARRVRAPLAGAGATHDQPRLTGADDDGMDPAGRSEATASVTLHRAEDRRGDAAMEARWRPPPARRLG